MALAQENVPLAMELLETAFIRGQWLIFQVHAPFITLTSKFQNVDLVPNFLPKLDKRIQEKDPEDVHEDFRVWMTWTQGRLPTFSLLQRAIVLSCEPCRDIRYHNSNFLYNIPLKVTLLNLSCDVFPSDGEAARVPPVHPVPHPWILAKGYQ